MLVVWLCRTTGTVQDQTTRSNCVSLNECLAAAHATLCHVEKYIYMSIFIIMCIYINTADINFNRGDWGTIIEHQWITWDSLYLRQAWMDDQSRCGSKRLVNDAEISIPWINGLTFQQTYGKPGFDWGVDLACSSHFLILLGEFGRLTSQHRLFKKYRSDVNSRASLVPWTT